MKSEIIMPKIGLDMTEGTISKWVKQVGDRVEADEVLLEIETDKAVTDVKSHAAGTLVEITAEEGETVEITEIIGWLDTDE